MRVMVVVLVAAWKGSRMSRPALVLLLLLVLVLVLVHVHSWLTATAHSEFIHSLLCAC